MKKLDEFYTKLVEALRKICFKIFKPDTALGKVIDKLVNKEVISYLFFGVLTTVVSWVSYALFVKVLGVSGPDDTLKISVCNVLSWIAAVLFAYITNKIFVFESRSFKPSVLGKELVSFVGSRLLTGVIEWVGVPLLVKIGLNQVIAGTEGMLAKILVSIIVVILNYVFSKLFVFKGKKTEGNEAE